MEPPLRILQLCNKPPYPPVDGGCVAMNVLSKGIVLRKQYLKVLSFSSYKHPVVNLPAEYLEGTRFESVFLKLKPSFWKAFLNLFSTRSYIMARFVSDAFAKRLIEILEETSFDIVQMESLYVTPYIPIIRQYSKAKIILRPQNVESQIWKRLSKTEKNPLKRIYFVLLSARLKKEEKNALLSVDGILPITPKDEESFYAMGIQKLMQTLPVALDDNLMPTEIIPEIPSLFYIGAMNWQPNKEGLYWFLKQVWPRIHQAYPDLKFYIAGRYMPLSLLKAKYPNVVVLGEVEDAKVFIASKQIMIVPILSGSGVRIKLIEGMTAGKMVISTTIGAEGIDYTDRKDIWIADSSQEFVEAVGCVIKNPELAVNIGKNARELILTNHGTEKVLDDLFAFYKKLCKHP